MAKESAIVKGMTADLLKVAPELAGDSSLTIVDELVGVWSKKTAGDIIVGEITHLYWWESENDDGVAETVRGVGVILRAPAVVSSDEGEKVAKPGDVVGITLGRKLDCLRYQRPGDVIAVVYLGEVKLNGARKTHRYRVRASAPPRETPMVDAGRKEPAF